MAEPFFSITSLVISSKSPPNTSLRLLPSAAALAASFGSSATNAETKEEAAIKRIANAFDNRIDAKRTLRNIKLLTHMDHENVYLFRSLLMGSVCTILLMEHAPLLYHAYFAMTIFLWVQVCCEYLFLNAVWKYMLRKEISYFVKLLVCFVVSVFILEILVKSVMDRKIYTWSFLTIGVVAAVYLLYSVSLGSWISVFIRLASCPYLL